MLELYIMKELHDCELCNDVFFDYSIFKDTKFNKEQCGLIKNIDGVTLIDRFKIKSKYGGCVIPIYKLSSGCKTAINIARYNDKIFFIGECGNNALREIFNMKNGKICINYFFVPPAFNNEVMRHFEHTNKDIIISNNEQLEDLLFDIFYNHNYIDMG